MHQAFTSFAEFRQRYPLRPNEAGSLLGSGSYGRVFKVEDQLETEWVAIKISEFKGDEAKSLKAEVDLAQRVPRQANIARYDACYRLETDTSISDFAVMKYYADGNLADLLRNQKTLSPEQICDITRGILLGLQHLHRHRIVHRDFKPANILISRDNAGRFVPKIADFGLSRLVNADELDNSDFDLSDGRGTPSYKAPEQIEGSRVSFNLDLWAFGVILYEMLTGEKPFRADGRNTSEQSVRREIEKKIVSVDLPERLTQVAEPYQSLIRRCLVRDIHERARREDELLDLLDEIPALLAEANRLAIAGHYEGAIEHYEKVLNRRNHHAQAEKELARCRTALNGQRIDTLVRKAQDYVAQQDYESAQAQYAQVLQLDPTHSTAAQGLSACVEALRPKPVSQPETVANADVTDVYVEERTDAYVPPAPPVVEPPKPATSTVAKPTPPRPAVTPTPAQVSPTAAVTQPSVPATAAVPTTSKSPIARQLAVPVLVGMMGIAAVVYYVSRPKSETTIRTGGTSTPTVTGGLTRKPINDKNSETVTPVKSSLDADPAIITRRVDVALAKARQAYQQQNYVRTLELTGSALKLDPTRTDVARLHRMAEKASEATTSTEPVGDGVASGTPPKTESPIDNSPKEPEKTEPKKPVEVAPAVNTRQQIQQQYDDLIDDGKKAIDNSNNKTKAIADFSRARSLAKEHDLQTPDVEALYSRYMSKANKIFASGAYEGALGWYQVAQVIKDTPDVRVKIKECRNYLSTNK